MGRRVTTGTVGGSGLGSINVTSNTISTASTNQDLILDPNGTGGVNVVGDLSITNQSDLRLLESTGNGTNYIAQQASASMAANYTITWPAAVAASNGLVLSSDTSGNLSWVSAGGAIAVSDPGSTATVHYPFFGTNAGALPSTLTPLARSNLSFIPSTGELIATIGSFANIIGATTASATVTIRGTSSGTKAAASVLMTDNVSSTSNGTGTLVVTGGVGVSGNINYGGTIQRNTAGGVNSPSARFGSITTSTKLDVHIQSSSGGSSATNTQQYGISFTNGTGATHAAIACAENGSDGTAIGFFTNNNYGQNPAIRAFFDPAGQFLPAANNTYDLGNSSLRWRTIFTTDLELSNGIGDYTIVEGEEDLFIYNNKNGKTYKFLLQEVDKSVVPPKKAGIPGA